MITSSFDNSLHFAINLFPSSHRTSSAFVLSKVEEPASFSLEDLINWENNYNQENIKNMQLFIFAYRKKNYLGFFRPYVIEYVP